MPSAVLVALGIRAIGREEELAEKRAAEQKRRSLTLVRQELLNRLENLELHAAAGRLPRP